VAPRHSKKKGKDISYNTKSEEDIKEGTQDELESNIEDCIIVDIK
jgi:hypothetical protein